MGLLDKLFGASGELARLRAENIALKQQQVSVGSSAPAVLSGGGSVIAPPAASLNLGAAREQLSHFRGHQATAIQAIAKRVAGAKLCVGIRPTRPRKLVAKSASGNDLEPLPAHELLDVLDDPNPLMVRFNLLWLLIVHLECCGIAYWWKRYRNDDGRLELWPLPPHWVKPLGPIGASNYEVRPHGAPEPFTIPVDEMAVFALPDPSDPYGGVFSPMSAQASAINADENILRAQAAAFENGIHPGVVVRAGTIDAPSGEKIRRTLTPQQRKGLTEAILGAFRGVLRRGEPIVLDSLIEGVDKWTNTPEEMDFLDSARWTRGRILQAYGVNPSIVGELENSNRAAAWVAEENFNSNVVNPLLVLIGQCLTEWVSKPEYGDNCIAWFEPQVAHDAELFSKNFAIALQRGVVTPNEYRRNVLNLPDIEGGDELPTPSINITNAAADEIDKAFRDYTGETYVTKTEAGERE